MIIAHRGVHNNIDIPENSIKAFKKALDNKYNIEFDIHVTKDNKLVVFHDDNLKRMTGLNKKIEDLTLDEIRSLKLLNTNERIPLFKEVLDLVNGKVLLDIEIKNTKKIKLVCDLVLKELNNYSGDIILKSFNPLIVRYLKRKSNYKVGILISKKKKNINSFVDKILINISRYDFIAIDKRLFNYKYYNKYNKKCPIYVWTFKEVKDIDDYMDRYPEVNLICNNLDK